MQFSPDLSLALRDSEQCAYLAQGIDASAPARFMEQNRWARPVLGAIGLFFAGTFLLSVVRVLRRHNSPRSKRTRTVNLNKVSLDGTWAALNSA